MRKLIVFNMTTSDGYYKGQNEDISWHQVDEEVNGFIIEQMKTTEMLLFGRKTFEVMEDFWPTEKAFETDPVVAEMMSSYTKIVFSSSRENTTWENTRFLKEKIIEEVKKLKDQQGTNMFVFGSGDLCRILIQHHLIDEFRLMVNPVVLGKGMPFFHTKMNMQLLKTRIFGNGNVLMNYRPINEIN